MSIVPLNRPTLTLNVGKYFRNVIGSTTSAGIGSGDPFPFYITSWLKAYELYTRTPISSPYKCPGCGNSFQRSELKGAHIVLGKSTDNGSAPSAINLSNAAVCFRPIRLIRGRPWRFTYNGRMGVTHSDRVFILPICTNCNNMGGDIDIQVQESKKVARLICYGYTNDYVKYMNLYEGPFFQQNRLRDIADNQTIFEDNISTYVYNTTSAWETTYAALNAFDSGYLSSSQPSPPATLSRLTFITRSGHSYN